MHEVSNWIDDCLPGVPAGRRFFFVVAAAPAAVVVAICSDRNGSGVASSGGDPAAGAQNPSMGDVGRSSTDRSCEEHYGTRRRARKISSLPFVPNDDRPPAWLANLIRRMWVGVGLLAVYIAAGRRRGRRRDQQPDGKQTRDEAKREERRVELMSLY
jgi:hypothetical protein